MKKIIVTLLFMACVAGSYAQDAVRSIRETLVPFVEAGDVAGVAAVIADREKVIETVCLGYGNIEDRIKMDGNSLFWIASQSKPVTAAAVMMLVDEGKISLDEPVTTYLPELSGLKIKDFDRNGVVVLTEPSVPVTLRHLLSHTGGMTWIAGVQERIGRIDVLPFSLSLPVSAMTPLLFEPGERYSYSNQGINIAATVVERVSGMPFEDFLRHRLFGPLGMESATFWPEGKQLSKVVIPYTKGTDGNLVPVEIGQLQYPLDDRSKRYAEAAGGLFCSPNDLVKFYQMVSNNGVYDGKRYLSESSVAEMGSKQTGDLPDPYGLGWWVSDDAMGHGGAMGTNTIIHRKSGYVVMFFALGEELPRFDDVVNAFNKAVADNYNL